MCNTKPKLYVNKKQNDKIHLKRYVRIKTPAITLKLNCDDKP